ncbi:MAG: hypothetical protein WCK57_04915 [Verrucomicrobiae bacterium]
MHFALGTIAKEVPGPKLTVDCLWCGQQTNAHSRKRTEWLMLFHIVPLFPFHTIFVQCDSCHEDMVAKCSLDELGRSNLPTLKYLLAKRVSFVGKVCIIIGVLLCWAPLIGVIPATIGFFYRREYGNWMRKMSICGLVVSSLSTLFGIAGLFFSK